MRESKIEAHLCKTVKAAGGEALKFVSPGRRSVPDRIVLMPPRTAKATLECAWCNPAGRTVFVELKAAGKVPTEAQQRMHDRMRRLGHTVVVLDSVEGVDAFVRGLQC